MQQADTAPEAHGRAARCAAALGADLDAGQGLKRVLDGADREQELRCELAVALHGVAAPERELRLPEASARLKHEDAAQGAARQWCRRCSCGEAQPCEP